MKKFISVFLIVSACAQVQKPVVDPVVMKPPMARPVMGVGKSAAALDTTTTAQRAAALKPAGGGQRLGTVLVGLGSPADQGFWVSAPVIAVAGKGRVDVAGGKSVAVELRPSANGALMSLAAFRALGLDLTDLPEITIYAE